VNHVFNRSLRLPSAGTETLFLWGPRQTGKTTLLRRTYPDALWIDLLKADEFRMYATRPERLRELVQAGAPPSQVVIDEVQKVPALLDEVHWLHEHMGLAFALCGSSARKVRRGGANLLGGRAVRYELHGITAGEIGREFDLVRMLNHGWLPRVYASHRPGRLLESYVADYLKEEIAAEGLVRNLPVFATFLEAAALSDGGLVNFANIARECGVSGHTVKGYFEILEDTLMGRWLPAYTRRSKRRVIAAPKFYFADVGVVNHLARRSAMLPGSELFGRAFESWVFHELSTHVAYGSADPRPRLSYWRLAGGTEVDFIVDDARVAIEAKATTRVTSDHVRGLRELAIEHPGVKPILVCLEPRRRLSNGVRILPARDFVDELAGGGIV
jgi:predicted AAA+ superfamily ATPase